MAYSFSSPVLVTGASGFIGKVLVERLAASGVPVRRGVRRRQPGREDGAEVAYGDIGADTDWREAVGGCQAVIHLAGRAHVAQERAVDPMAEYRRVNVAGSERLARAAVAAGVRRLVYVSSIGVNGNASRRPFVETDTPVPRDFYAVSKYEAELKLHDAVERTGMELVVVRPALVYGPGCPGNLQRLMALIERRLPLPLASVRNRRSLLGVHALAELLLLCLTRPDIAGRTFLAADAESLSIAEIVRTLASGMGVRPMLLPCPLPVLKAGSRWLGVEKPVERLTGTLEVCPALAAGCLGWQPGTATREGLRATGLAYAQGGVRPLQGATGLGAACGPWG